MVAQINSFIVCGMADQINRELEKRNINPRDIVSICHLPRHITQYGSVSQSYHILHRRDPMTELDFEQRQRIEKIISWFHNLDIDVKKVVHEDRTTYAVVHFNNEEFFMRATKTNGRVNVSRDNPKYTHWPEDRVA